MLFNRILTVTQRVNLLCSSLSDCSCQTAAFNIIRTTALVFLTFSVKHTPTVFLKSIVSAQVCLENAV